MIRYIICYDITSDDRRNKVFKIMKGAGTHLQYSVFQCDLSDRGREQLITDLTNVIMASEDQVLFIDLGPADGRAPQISTRDRPAVRGGGTSRPGVLTRSLETPDFVR